MQITQFDRNNPQHLIQLSRDMTNSVASCTSPFNLYPVLLLISPDGTAINNADHMDPDIVIAHVEVFLAYLRTRSQRGLTPPNQ